MCARDPGFTGRIWVCFVHLAPKTSATSAPASAADRAGFTFRSWLSDTTPRPMAVARNGRPVASTSARSAESAWEYAAPLPTTTSGLRGTHAEVCRTGRDSKHVHREGKGCASDVSI